MSRAVIVAVACLAASAAQSATYDALYCNRNGAEMLSIKGNDKAINFEVSYFRPDNGNYFGMSGRALMNGKGWHFNEVNCVVDIVRAKKAMRIEFDGCQDYGGFNAVPAPLKFSHRYGKAQSLSLESKVPDC